MLKKLKKKKITSTNVEGKQFTVIVIIAKSNFY